MVEQETVEAETEEQPAGASHKVGVVFNFNHNTFPGFQLEAVTGETNDEQNSFVGKVEKIDLSKFVDLNTYSDADKQLITSLRKLQDAEVTKYLNRNSPFSGIWENIIHHETDDMPDETRQLVVEFMHPKLKKLYAEINANPLVFYLNGKKVLKTDNLKPLMLQTDTLVPQFSVVVEKDGVAVNCHVLIQGVLVEVSENKLNGTLLFFYNGSL